jgi:hypothetical protein
MFGWRAMRAEQFRSTFLEPNDSTPCLKERNESFQFYIWLVEYERSHHMYHTHVLLLHFHEHHGGILHAWRSSIVRELGAAIPHLEGMLLLELDKQDDDIRAELGWSSCCSSLTRRMTSGWSLGAMSGRSCCSTSMRRRMTLGRSSGAMSERSYSCEARREG